MNKEELAYLKAAKETVFEDVVYMLITHKSGWKKVAGRRNWYQNDHALVILGFFRVELGYYDAEKKFGPEIRREIKRLLSATGCQ